MDIWLVFFPPFVLLTWFQIRFHGKKFNLKHNFHGFVQLGFQQFQPWIRFWIFWLLDLFSFAIVHLSTIWYFIHPCLFCFLIMATERDDSLQYVSVRLDGKNYSY